MLQCIDGSCGKNVIKLKLLHLCVNITSKLFGKFVQLIIFVHPFANTTVFQARKYNTLHKALSG